jgi:hypothetical protein
MPPVEKIALLATPGTGRNAGVHRIPGRAVIASDQHAVHPAERDYPAESGSGGSIN